MDHDLLAFQAAKKVAARFTDTLQRSTHSCADVSIARSAEFKGVWGVELHAMLRDDTIDSIMLMNYTRYVVVNDNDIETHGSVSVRDDDGAVRYVPCIISYPLVTTEDRK